MLHGCSIKWALGCVISSLRGSRNPRSDFLNLPIDREGVDGVAVAAIKIANHFGLSIVPPSCNSSGAKKGLSLSSDGFETTNLSYVVICSTNGQGLFSVVILSSINVSRYFGLLAIIAIFHTKTQCACMNERLHAARRQFAIASVILHPFPPSELRMPFVC